MENFQRINKKKVSLGAEFDNIWNCAKLTEHLKMNI